VHARVRARLLNARAAQEHELRVEADGDKPVFLTLRAGAGEIFGARASPL
jgi:hypothetical protein